jgi:hypothetical protein
MNNDDNETKKVIALGRDRDAALHVIMPCLMGAFERHGKVVAGDPGEQVLEVLTDRFWMCLVPDVHHVHFFVFHRCYRYVLSGRLFSDGSGKCLDGRVSVVSWDRSSGHRAWQAELFDVFAEDSTWLLDIPQKLVRPEIVTALLSHIASRSIRPVEHSHAG